MSQDAYAPLPSDDPWTQFRADPRIQKLLNSGDGAGLYDLLLSMKREPRGEAEREAIGRLLSDRRRFAQPVKSAPELRTVNGLGLMLYGKSEEDPRDGSYIATHWVVFLFIPLWPVRQYLVRPAEGGGYYFLGRVPTSRLLRVWRVAVGLLFAGWLAVLFTA